MKTKPIHIENLTLGGGCASVMAGPCSIENFDQFQLIVKFLKKQGVSIIRGGIFKPRTSPDDFQGLREKAFSLVKELKKKENFIFITEITDPRQLESLNEIADIFQVGARNMYNYELLKELSLSRRPVLLKRSFSATIREWVSAAHYLEKGGSQKIILCERGVRTFETAYRNTFDINAVAYLKKNFPYPVFVDPSHATGDSSLVAPISKAALAAGADGLLIEVHNQPQTALSDGEQSLNFDSFSSLLNDIKSFL